MKIYIFDDISMFCMHLIDDCFDTDFEESSFRDIQHGIVYNYNFKVLVEIISISRNIVNFRDNLTTN